MLLFLAPSRKVLPAITVLYDKSSFVTTALCHPNLYCRKSLVKYPMPSPTSFVAYSRRCYVRGPSSVLVPAHNRDTCGHRLSWLARPLYAVNNQHSHLDDEFLRMQSQLSVQAPQTSHTWGTHRKTSSPTKHHVFLDTQLHPYQGQPQRYVHHEGVGDGGVSHNGDLANAVELSYQYSSNIVNYYTEELPLPRPAVHRARVVDYNHPSMLARDLILSLLSGRKLLLELPDEPAAVSSLLTALGQVATKLRTIGLVTALDPVYDPAAVGGSTCPSTGSITHASGHGHAGSHQQNHHNSHHNHHHNHSHGGSGGGSPSSSHDSIGSGGAAQRRSHDSGNGVFVFCTRAVPMPPSVSAADGTVAATYTVGGSMGQEVLAVGPSVAVHSLLPTLLSAVLRDGLVTLRCCWFDEELGADTWLDGDGVSAASTPIWGDQGDCEEHDGCDFASLLSSGNGSPGRPRSPSPGGPPAATVGDAHVHSVVAMSPAGSLVRVPCVLRAIFKLDRQLRSLDLGGLVVLPHTFVKSRRDSHTQLLHLDIVIA